jgi:biotin-(acetyl-CoA carboxylase) ligase
MNSWKVWTDGPNTLELLGWEETTAVENTGRWPRELGTLAEAAGMGNTPLPRKLPFPVEGWDWVLAVGQSRESQFDLLREVPSDARTHLGSVACLALAGQGFHGQHGRPWDAQRGNLHLSLLCPVDLDAASCHASLMMVPAVATLNAVRSVLGRHPAAAPGRLGIKWVNDLLCDGKKLGGVLTAARTQEGRLTSVTFGIGLNVAVAPDTGDDPWQTPATSLHQAAAGATPSMGAVLVTLLAEVRSCLDLLETHGPEVLHKAYCDGSLLIGRDVIFLPEAQGNDAEKLSKPRRAKVVGIGADLALNLESGAAPLTSGRVRLVDS